MRVPNHAGATAGNAPDTACVMHPWGRATAQATLIRRPTASSVSADTAGSSATSCVRQTMGLCAEDTARVSVAAASASQNGVIILVRFLLTRTAVHAQV